MPLRNSWRKHKLIAAVAIGGAIVIVTVAVIVGRTRKPVQMAPQSLVVDVVQVKQEDVPIYSEWIGTTDGMVNADIQAQVSGYLLRKAYTEGAFVRQGQLLFEIDPRPLQAVLNQAQGNLATAEGQVEQAVSQLAQAEAQLAQAHSQRALAEANQRQTQLNVNKYGPLLQKNAVTQQDFDNADQANEAAKAQIEVAKAQIKAASAAVGTTKAAIVTAKAQVQSSQAAVRTSELNLGFTKIVSPIDGIVGIALAQVGDLVSPTSGILTTVSTLDPIKVYFTVSEQEYMNYVKLNPTQAERAAAQKQLELQLFLSNGATYPHTGKFYVADRQVDPKTGAIRLAGVFPNSENILRPGQYGRVRAATSTQDGALLVPQRAVSQLQGLYRVAVVGSDNRVAMRTITPGPTVGQMWVIQDGLKAGETVMVDGTQKVTPGMTVNPRPFTLEAATAATTPVGS
ncbi:MAG: efflux RND transporter periplasmic adaptor subunit [Pyrinomonadaceae bacterium]|nr:efflux RND transporter periplasmic adaptor subunit [Pyrinomonadaceae bacterium]